MQYLAQPWFLHRCAVLGASLMDSYRDMLDDLVRQSRHCHSLLRPRGPAGPRRTKAFKNTAYVLLSTTYTKSSEGWRGVKHLRTLGYAAQVLSSCLHRS